MHVLLLDDARELRERYAEALEELPGVEVDAFDPDTLSVIREIEARRPEVVIVDVQMARGGALGLIHDIKAVCYPPIVIALSSVSSRVYRSRCRQVGAEFFFDKVRESEALLQTVGKIQHELES